MSLQSIARTEVEVSMVWDLFLLSLKANIPPLEGVACAIKQGEVSFRYYLQSDSSCWSESITDIDSLFISVSDSINSLLELYCSYAAL